jgi:hypothetical protein
MRNTSVPLAIKGAAVLSQPDQNSSSLSKNWSSNRPTSTKPDSLVTRGVSPPPQLLGGNSAIGQYYLNTTNGLVVNDRPRGGPSKDRQLTNYGNAILKGYNKIQRKGWTGVIKPQKVDPVAPRQEPTIVFVNPRDIFRTKWTQRREASVPTGEFLGKSTTPEGKFKRFSSYIRELDFHLPKSLLLNFWDSGKDPKKSLELVKEYSLNGLLRYVKRAPWREQLLTYYRDPTTKGLNSKLYKFLNRVPRLIKEDFWFDFLQTRKPPTVKTMSRISIISQGSIQSQPSHSRTIVKAKQIHIHPLETIFSTITESIHKAFGTTKEWVRFADFVSIVNIYHNVEMGAYRMAALNALSLLDCPLVQRALTFDYFSLWAKDLPSFFKVKDDPFWDMPPLSEEDIEYEAGVGSVVNRVRRSPLMLKFLEFVSRVVGANIAKDHVTWTQFVEGVMKLYRSPMSSADLFLDLVVLCDYVKERAEVAIQKSDPWQFFEASLEVNLTMEMDRLMLVLKNQRQLDPTMLRTLCDEADVCLARAISLKDKNPIVQSTANELRKMVNEIRSEATNVRIPPAAFIFTGPTGLGKTVAISTISRWLANEKDIPKDVQVVHFVQETKHQEVMCSPFFWVYNDAFQVKEEYREISYITEMQTIADSTPYSFQAASIAAKSMSFIAPHYTIMTTNNINYNFSTSTGGASKLIGRWKVVNFKLSPEGQKVFDEWNLGRNSTTRVWTQENPDNFKYVYYEVGTMGVQKNDSWINFSIVNLEHTFYNLVELCNYMRDQRLALERQHGPAKCTCGAKFCDGKHPEFLSSKLALSVKVVKVEPKFSDYFRFPTNFEEVSEEGNIQVAVQHSLKDENLLKLMAVLAGGCGIISLAILSVGIMIRTKMPSQVVVDVSTENPGLTSQIGIAGPPMYYKQGATVGSLTEPYKETPSFVRDYKGNQVPWLTPAPSREPVLLQRVDNNYNLFGFWLVKNLIVFPLHFLGDKKTPINEVKEGFLETLISVKWRNQHITFRITKKDLIFCDTDMVIMHAPGFVGSIAYMYPLMKDFMPESFMGSILDQKAIVYFRDGFLTSTYSSKDGDCGLILWEDEVPRGYHIGRNVKTGMALSIPLYKHYFDPLIQEMFKLKGVVPTCEEMPPALVKEMNDGHLSPGVHPQSDAGWIAKTQNLHDCGHSPIGHYNRFEPGKMTCRKTVLFPYYGHLCEEYGKPHVGHAKKFIKDGKEEWGSPSVYRILHPIKPQVVDQQAIDIALYSVLLDVPIPEQPLETLTFQQAVCGDRRNGLFNPRDNDKAVGYSLGIFGVKKDAFVKQPNGDWEPHPKLLEQFNDLLDIIKSDRPLPRTIVRSTFKAVVYPQR